MRTSEFTVQESCSEVIQLITTCLLSRDSGANDAIDFPRSDFRGEKELLSALAEKEPTFADVNHFLSESVSPSISVASLSKALVASEPRGTSRLSIPAFPNRFRVACQNAIFRNLETGTAAQATEVEGKLWDMHVKINNRFRKLLSQVRHIALQDNYNYRCDGAEHTSLRVSGTDSDDAHLDPRRPFPRKEETSRKAEVVEALLEFYQHQPTVLLRLYSTALVAIRWYPGTCRNCEAVRH